MRPTRRRPTSIFRPLAALFLAAVAALLTPTGVGAQSVADGKLEIDVLDVGQGDSILIRSPEGKTALIDAGPSRDAAAQHLRRKGIEAVDLVVVTHHHTDHFGGMEPVLRDFHPRYYVATTSEQSSRTYLKLLEVVKSEGIAMVAPANKPRRIELGSVTMTILPQPPFSSKNENDNSIGLRVQYGGFAMLLTGDSEVPERKWWAENCPDLVRDCCVMKLAHHGSHNGTDADWLGLVRPDLAVVSLGAGNSFGHPHAETLDLLREHQLPLMRTDQWGTITLLSDGRTWNLATPSVARRSGSFRPSRPVAAAPSRRAAARR